MKRPRSARSHVAAFEVVKAVGLTLPGVAATTRYDSSPVLRVGGCFMAGLVTNHAAEPDTLVVRVDMEHRQYLLEDAPEIYYLTEYHRKYPVVLARLARLDREALRDLLSASRSLTLAKIGTRQSRER